jgi:GNAT superfamily N-acetyltransferase
VAVRTATKADYDLIVSELADFWGERDLRALHHPVFIHEFRDTALVYEDDWTVAGYLLGFISPSEPVGYVHLVAVRRSHRKRGIGRTLYNEFTRLAHARGCSELKAVTTPTNAGSIAFHRSLGMSAEEIGDYAGPGRPRTVFRKELA